MSISEVFSEDLQIKDDIYLFAIDGLPDWQQLLKKKDFSDYVRLSSIMKKLTKDKCEVIFSRLWAREFHSKGIKRERVPYESLSKAMLLLRFMFDVSREGTPSPHVKGWMFGYGFRNNSPKFPKIQVGASWPLYINAGKVDIVPPPDAFEGKIYSPVSEFHFFITTYGGFADK